MEIDRKKLAVALFREHMLIRNTLDTKPLPLDDVDWDKWYGDAATSPLDGANFVAIWEHMADVAVKLTSEQ